MSTVDVLAVMDSLRSVMYGPLIDGKPGVDSPLDAQAVEARAAVAELIAQRDAAIEGIEKALEEVADAGPKALKYVEQELQAALARCKGEQA